MPDGFHRRRSAGGFPSQVLHALGRWVMGIFGSSAPGQPRYPGTLHHLQVAERVYATCAPIVFGTCRVHAKLLFYGGFYATKAPNSGGKGLFGGKATEYIYYADVLG